MLFLLNTQSAWIVELILIIGPHNLARGRKTEREQDSEREKMDIYVDSNRTVLV